MLKRNLWIAIISGVLVTASFAQADLLAQEVNQDLFFSYLSNSKQDRYQKAFGALGVHPVPSMLTEQEQRELRPAANILWNREYELRRLPGMIKKLKEQSPPNLEEIAKREKEFKNQPALLVKAKNIYNKRVDDIVTERASALIEKMPSTSPQITVCSGMAISDKKAQATQDSANPVSALASDTAKIVQQNVRDEQLKDERSSDWTEASSKLPSQKDLAQGEASISSIHATLLGNPAATSIAAPNRSNPNVRPTSAPLPAPAPISVPSFDLSSVSQEDVPDSRFTLTGTTPLPNQGVQIIIHKEGEQNSTARQITHVTSDANGHFDLPAYMDRGQGNYNADVYFQNLSGTDRSAYLPAKSFKLTNHDAKDETYLLPTRAVQSDDPKIASLSRQIIRDAGATTDLAKAKAINDWMSLNVTYDTQELARIRSGEEKTAEKTALDVLEASPKPMGVCYGYSMLYAALSRAAGLPTKVVYGQIREGEHAWNEVQVDGVWKPVDSTGDSPQFKNGVLTPGEEYFEISQPDFAKTHQATEVEAI